MSIHCKMRKVCPAPHFTFAGEDGACWVESRLVLPIKRIFFIFWIILKHLERKPFCVQTYKFVCLKANFDYFMFSKFWCHICLSTIRVPFWLLTKQCLIIKSSSFWNFVLLAELGCTTFIAVQHIRLRIRCFCHQNGVCLKTKMKTRTVFCHHLLFTAGTLTKTLTQGHL